MGSLILGILLVAFAVYLLKYPLSDEEKEIDIKKEYMDES